MNLKKYFQSGMALSLLAAMSLGNIGCEANAGTGALAGAAAGAAIAGIATDGRVLEGALIGAGVGAVAGHIAKAKRYNNQGGNPGNQQNFPVARYAGNNQVYSPYPPNGLIDVTGFRSGEIAVDPTSGQPFRVP